MSTIKKGNDWCAPYCKGCKWAIYFIRDIWRCCQEIDSVLIGTKDGGTAYLSISARVVSRGLRTKKHCVYYSKKNQ